VDLVKDKEKANFCEYFIFSSYRKVREQKSSSKDDVRKKWDSLFKNEE
jgi:hypothetical protein